MTVAMDATAVVEGYVAAAQAGDAERLRSMFAPDATWHLDGGLPISGTWTGRDAILDQFLATAMGYYERGSVTLEITGVIADGDQVVVEWTSRARTLGGDPYENHCIGVFTVQAGQIQSVREYMDTHYAHVAFAHPPR